MQPPAPLGHETTRGAWELAIPDCELETSTEVRATSTMTPTKRIPKLSSAEGTPIPAMKYLIQTPPRVASALANQTGSPSTHLESPAASLATNSISPFEVQPLSWIEVREWPTLEEFFITVPEWANCSICSDLFDEPVQWPNCEHTFCKACVTRLLTYGHRECPMCRGVLPNDVGFADLQHAVRMSSALLLLPVRCRWGLAAIRSSRGKAITTTDSAGDALENSSSSSIVSSSTSAMNQAQLQTESSKLHHSNIENASQGGTGANTPISNNGIFGPSGSFDSNSAGGLSSSMSSVEQYLQHALKQRGEYTQWIPREDSQGCPEFVPLSSLREHMTSCQYAPARCLHSGCGLLFLRSDIETHQRECAHRPVQCPSCNDTLSKSSLASHLLTCPEVCINCTCGQSMPRKVQQKHFSEDCPDSQLGCPFTNHGCTYYGKRATLSQHLTTCPYEAVKGYIARTEAKFEAYDRDIERLESMVLALRSQIHVSSTSSRNALHARSAHQHRHGGMHQQFSATSSSLGGTGMTGNIQQGNPTNSNSAKALGMMSQGSVGHGRRSGRFWDDYDDFDFSDDEFSIHL